MHHDGRTRGPDRPRPSLPVRTCRALGRLLWDGLVYLGLGYFGGAHLISGPAGDRPSEGLQAGDRLESDAGWPDAAPQALTGPPAGHPEHMAAEIPPDHVQRELWAQLDLEQ